MSAISNIRKNLSSTGSSIIVGLIVFVLVATFGGFIGNSNISSNEIFSVNGKGIHIGEYNLEANRISSNFDESQNFTEEDIESFTRESIIFKEMFSQQAESIGLKISEKNINDLIRNDLSLYSEEKFDADLFRGLLTRLGMTIDDYRELIESKYLASRLLDFYDNTAFVSTNEAKNFIANSKQKRDLRFRKISLEELATLQEISNEEIENYYNNYPSEFKSLKKINFRSVFFSKNNFMESFQVTSDEIENEKIAIKSSENLNGQIRASHIQLSYDDEQAKEGKRIIANEIVSRIDLGEESFEELVLLYSDDIGTNKIGGDLGFTDGTVFPEEFERELATLNLQEVSQIIELDDSFHILKVTQKNIFDLSDEQVAERILSVKSEEELQNILNEIYENLDNTTLSEISESYDFLIQDNKNLSITNLVTEFEGLEFIDDFDRNNIFINELYGPYNFNGGYILIEPYEFFPSTLKSLSDVKNEIEETLKLASAQIIMPEKINEEISNLQNVVNLERFSSYSDVERNTSLFPQEVTNLIFSISQLKGDNSIISTVHLGDAYIIQLLGVTDFEGIISLEEITETKNALNLALNEIEKDNFYGKLREEASIN
ncbi:SurA N-terminal domain-containing protein [SAR86 cluster bacterium]|nr:SurA N-terminal domain-containing protein [SAR86 cluster bacterium]